MTSSRIGCSFFMSELTIIGIVICIIAFLWTWTACVLAGRADDEMEKLNERIAPDHTGRDTQQEE